MWRLVPLWRAVRQAAPARARHGPVRAEAWLGLCASPPQCGTTASNRPTAGVDDKESFMADETYKGEFYCVKCKEKREAEGKVVVSENGRRMAKGVCPVCGTNLNRILGKA